MKRKLSNRKSSETRPSTFSRPSHISDSEFTERKGKIKEIFDYIAGDDALIQKEELKKW